MMGKVRNSRLMMFMRFVCVCLIATFTISAIPSQVEGSKFDELLPHLGHLRDLLANKYFVVSMSAPIQNNTISYGVGVRTVQNWASGSINGTLRLTGTNIRIAERYIICGYFVTFNNRYLRINKVQNDGSLVPIRIHPITKTDSFYGSTGPGGCYLSEINWEVQFNINNLPSGLYLISFDLVGRRTNVYDGWGADINMNYHIPFEIIYPSISASNVIYAKPGQDVEIHAYITGSPNNVTATLIDTNTKLPVQRTEYSQELPIVGELHEYKITHHIPEGTPDGKSYPVLIRAEFADGSFQQAFSFIIVDSNYEEVSNTIQLDLWAVCPFIVDPLWSLQGGQVTIGCQDNPDDGWTVVRGEVFIPSVGTHSLVDNGNGVWVANINAPAKDGVYQAIYQIVVENSRGRSYTVSGNQSLIVSNTTDNARYCTPSDAVESSIDLQGKGSIRLIR